MKRTRYSNSNQELRPGYKKTFGFISNVQPNRSSKKIARCMPMIHDKYPSTTPEQEKWVDSV